GMGRATSEHRTMGSSPKEEGRDVMDHYRNLTATDACNVAARAPLHPYGPAPHPPQFGPPPSPLPPQSQSYGVPPSQNQPNYPPRSPYPVNPLNMGTMMMPAMPPLPRAAAVPPAPLPLVP